MNYGPWSHKELDTTELTPRQTFQCKHCVDRAQDVPLNQITSTFLPGMSENWDSDAAEPQARRVHLTTALSRSPSSPPRSCEVLGSCTWDSAFCPDTPRKPLVLLGEKDQAGGSAAESSPGGEGLANLSTHSDIFISRLQALWSVD